MVAVIAAALLATSGAAAQGEGRGGVTARIVDSIGRFPLSGASVRLLELELRTDTHQDGRFTLSRVPSGEWTIQIRRIGYAPKRLTVVVDSSTLQLGDIALPATVIELPDLVTTGSLSAREADRALLPLTVLDGEALARQLGATLAETLERQAGIASVSTGPATARPVIRGLGGDRILLLEDGSRIGDMSYSAPDHGVASDPFSAERVEVVRGPAALMYGSNALSGVVNTIREEIPLGPVSGIHGQFGLQGTSSIGGVTAGGNLRMPLGGMTLRLEGNGRHTGDLRTPLGRVANTAMDRWQGAVGLGRSGDWGHGGVALRRFTSSYGIPGGYVGGHDEGVTIEMERTAVRGELHHRTGFGPFSELQARASGVDYSHRELEAGGFIGTEFTLRSADVDLILRHDEVGPLSGGGIGIRLQHRDYRFGGSVSTPDARETGIAGFLLEEYESGPVRVEAGLRYDWTRIVPSGGGAAARTRTFGAMSGSIGMLVDVAAGVGVGANLGRAFRVPDVNDLFSRGPHLAVYRDERGNPDLDIEVGTGVDLFLRVSRPGIRGEIAFFRNGIDGFIYPRETGDTSQRGLPIARYVGRDARMTGLEGRVELVPAARLALGINGSWVRGTLVENGQPLPLIPPLNGNVELRWQDSDWYLGTGVRLIAAQRRLGEFETPTDGSTVLHLAGGFRWQRAGLLHSVSLRVDNATNTAYRNHLSRIKSIMPEAGRGVNLLYRIDF